MSFGVTDLRSIIFVALLSCPYKFLSLEWHVPLLTCCWSEHSHKHTPIGNEGWKMKSWGQQKSKGCLYEGRENEFSVKLAISATPLLVLEWAVRALHPIGYYDWFRERFIYKQNLWTTKCMRECNKNGKYTKAGRYDSVLGNPFLPDLMVDWCKPGAA